MRPLVPNLPDAPKAQPVGFKLTVVLRAADISAMSAALEQLAAGERALPVVVAGGLRAAARELRSIRGALSADGCELFGSPGQPALDPIRRRGSTDGCELFACEKEVALDFAAYLLEVATTLRNDGRHLAAFALEGIEGRLLEALVTAPD